MVLALRLAGETEALRPSTPGGGGPLRWAAQMGL